jgi:DNA-binding response OmpR family regulator
MASGTRHSVLVVDEFADAATTLADALTMHGHECRAVTSREDLLHAFDQFQPSVVVIEWVDASRSDSGMMRGLLEHIAQLAVDVRIFVLSAEDPPNDFKFSRHVEAYLSKPTTSERLHKMIAALPIPPAHDN